MKREEVSQAFITLNWLRYRDEVGDSIIIKRLNDRIIWCVVRNNSIGVEFNGNLSNDIFDKSDNFIDKTRRRYVDNSVICQKKFGFRKPEYNFDDIGHLSSQILEWAESCDIEAGLAALRALPTDCLGAMPVRHLAALAVAGDTETLGRYRDSFVAGDRLNFVPYIDEGYIDRALDFAEKRRADPNWMPDKPKMRV
jgi:hypothetical protein